jgi:hypothetical protein
MACHTKLLKVMNLFKNRVYQFSCTKSYFINNCKNNVNLQFKGMIFFKSPRMHFLKFMFYRNTI